MICIKVRFLRLGFILRSDKLGDEDQITSAVTIVKENLRAVKSGWEIGGKWKKKTRADWQGGDPQQYERLGQP